MEIKKGEILTLGNDAEYVVVASLVKDGKNYICMQNIANEKDTKICCERKTDKTLEVVFVKDEKLLKELAKSFYTQVQVEIKKEEKKA